MQRAAGKREKGARAETGGAEQKRKKCRVGKRKGKKKRKRGGRVSSSEIYNQKAEEAGRRQRSGDIIHKGGVDRGKVAGT